MSFILRNRRARLSVEYAALLAIVVAAILTVHVYMQRSLQGRYRALGDELGPQYEPGATFINNNVTTTTHSEEYEINSGSADGQAVTVTYTDSWATQDQHEEVTGN